MPRTKPRTQSAALMSHSLIAQVSAAVMALASVAVIAQPAQALSEDELFKFCSKYPNNSKCEGYDIPIPLSNRAGEEGNCALTLLEVSMIDRCKVLLNEESLTVYVEQGDRIERLEDQRRTEEFTVGLSSVEALTYREDESLNRDRLTTNTLLFGWLGAVLTKPDKVSLVEIQFAETPAEATLAPEPAETVAISSETESSEVSAINDEAESPEAIAPTNSPTPSSSSLVFETGRDQGRSMSDRIGELTSVTVRNSL